MILRYKIHKLFLAKEMVTAHHGTIREKSMGEGGLTFIVESEPFTKV